MINGVDINRRAATPTDVQHNSDTGTVTGRHGIYTHWDITINIQEANY
jgi:hypothetical protein